MLDNSQDKGIMSIRFEKTGNGLQLCETGFLKEPGKSNFYISYEDGCIFVDWGDGFPKDVIGYYQTGKDGAAFSKVLDKTKSRVIGRVGKELIYFCRKEADFTAGRYSPEEECLAFYTKNGNITALSTSQFVGYINGGEIGGAAAFVAVFFTFKLKSIYRDYFEMDNNEFRKKHAAYLYSLGI